MIVNTLVENTTINTQFKASHGLSFYIQTDKHNILFDVGENENFLHKARQLNVSIKDVDIVIISHAHFDHGGALDIFLKENNTALIYLQKTAFEKYYSVIGIINLI